MRGSKGFVTLLVRAAPDRRDFTAVLALGATDPTYQPESDILLG